MAPADGRALQIRAKALSAGLKKVMRGFGRSCRGKQRVYVKLVRQTERTLLELGEAVSALAVSAKQALEGAESVSPRRCARLFEGLDQALMAHQQIERQSRRLIHDKKLDHAKIVNAYDPSIAPIKKGKSNCPCQIGRKPGILAEMASGFIFSFHLPVGNPSDVSYVAPLVERLEKTIPQTVLAPSDKALVIRSVAGDLGLRDTTLRNQLHTKGILTVGIPEGIEPIEKQPDPETIEAICQDPKFQDLTPEQVELAYACGYSRPVVESIIYNLACRGGSQIKYKGLRGAHIQIGMAIMAHNAATLVRIRQNRLTKRAQKFRQLLQLKPPNSMENNRLIN